MGVAVYRNESLTIFFECAHRVGVMSERAYYTAVIFFWNSGNYVYQMAYTAQRKKI